MAKSRASLPPARRALSQALDSPNFPAYVAQMSAPALNGLIHMVGKADAQDIVAYASAAQMRELVALDVWSAADSMQQEELDADKLFEWVTLWLEIGPDFLRDRLRAVGSTLFAAALRQYTVVVDLQEVGIDGDFDAFGPFAVLPQETRNWADVRECLIEVYQVDAEFVLDALGASCLRRSLVSDTAALSDADVHAAADALGEHEDDQLGRGYVSPLQASVFLSEAKSQGLDLLMDATDYDALTRLSLGRLWRGRPVTDPPDETDDRAPGSAVAVADSAADGFAAIDQLLVIATAGLNNGATEFIARPEDQDDFLTRVLQGLAESDPGRLADRQDELVYLANVLVSGASFQGEPFPAAKAASAVSATCNLGMEYALSQAAGAAPALEGFANDAPGLVRSFRIGYHLLGQVSAQACVALLQALSTEQVQRRLHAHPWIHERVRAAIPADVSEPLAEPGRLIDALEMIFDHTACQRLRFLCDPFPCFPRSLLENSERIRVDKGWTFIKRSEEIARIMHFLQTARL